VVDLDLMDRLVFEFLVIARHPELDSGSLESIKSATYSMFEIPCQAHNDECVKHTMT
jgi:hypothetical protein